MRLGPAALDRLYGLIESTDIYAWLAVDPHNLSALDAALKARRGWAQAQQTNPKHRDPARWLIRHHKELRELMLREPEAFEGIHDRVVGGRARGHLVELMESLADRHRVLQLQDQAVVGRVAQGRGIEKAELEDIAASAGIQWEQPAPKARTSGGEGLQLQGVISRVLEDGSVPPALLNPQLKMGQSLKLEPSAEASMIEDESRSKRFGATGGT